MKVKLEKAEEAEQNRIEQLNEKARKSGKAIECQCCFDEVASQNTGTSRFTSIYSRVRNRLACGLVTGKAYLSNARRASRLRERSSLLQRLCC